jgi:hypothetical protein
MDRVYRTPGGANPNLGSVVSCLFSIFQNQRPPTFLQTAVSDFLTNVQAETAAPLLLLFIITALSELLENVRIFLAQIPKRKSQNGNHAFGISQIPSSILFDTVTFGCPIPWYIDA